MLARGSGCVGLAAFTDSLNPLPPFYFLPVHACIWAALILVAVVLFVAGAYKARVTVGNPGKSGLEMAVIGTVSALVGYVVGLLLRAPAVP